MSLLNKSFCKYTFIVFLLFPVFAQGQTFDDFKKQIKKEYSDFEKDTRKRFDDFVEKIDKEFSQYLSENFEPYTTDVLNKENKAPKPENIPEAKETLDTGEMIKYLIPKENFLIRQGPLLPGIKKTETEDFEVENVSFNFLGWDLDFRLDKKLIQPAPTEINPQNISNYWNEQSKSNYNHLLYQLSSQKEILNLNDWGYYQLIKKLSENLFRDDNNSRVFFQWMLLTRSRYKVKIGYEGNNVYLLVPALYPLYNTNFVRFNGLEYYVMGENTGEINTYPMDFPEADIIMDLRISSPFNTNVTKVSEKTFNFVFNDKQYSVKLSVDPEMIEFYKSVPLTDIAVYFNSVCSETAKNSIIETFTPLIKNLDEIDAADLLLKFVQSLGYKTDQQAYGKERYFFPEEVIYYPYSDCEDRSVLYAFLVKTLLKKDVVGVGFPGHMATAVHFDNKPEGYFLNYSGNSYVIADPTYTGASIGMLMPLAKGKEAEIVLTGSQPEKDKNAEELWEITRNAGGSRAGFKTDIAFDKEGNAYLCGYFIKEMKLDDRTITSTYNGRDAFVAKFDKNKQPVWLNKATGAGNDIAYNIAVKDDGNIVVFGSVENDLSFGGVTISAVGAPDVFVAEYNPDGRLLWAQKAGIDKIDHSSDFMFAAKFDGEGNKIMAKLFSESENFDHYGLTIDKDGNALITGSFYATPGMSSNDYKNYNELTNLDKPEGLVETNEELIQLQYEKTIAGLFAALNLIKYNNFELKGSDVQKAIEISGSIFPDKNKNLFDNFSKMHFIKNKGGIIIVKTDEEKPLWFSMVEVDNNARIKIIKYKSGNMAVQIFSGIYVSNGKIKLPMNKIKLYKENGDVLFDYGDDNTTKKLNLKKEILKRLD